MQIIFGILLVVHLIGFATLIGATLALLPSARKGKGFVPEMMFHGIAIVFVSGVFLIAVALAQGGLENVVSVVLKIGVTLALVIMILTKKKAVDLGPGFFAAVLALTAFNVAISVLL